MQILSLLLNVAIIWSQTEVTIPLNDSLESYKYEPYASLYIDDERIDDPLMYYEYEVNHTTFKVINTKHVGTYTVYYRVHFPTYGFESTESIQFIVKDLIFPIVTLREEIVLEVFSKPPDYLSYLLISDNHTPNTNLLVNIRSNDVIYNQIGTYRISFSVTDQSLNETVFQTNVRIIDSIRPIIKQKTSVMIKVNEMILIDKFFTFEDNYDKALKIELIDTGINYEKSGIYSGKLIVTDQSLNQTTLVFDVQIEDLEAPKIILKTQSMTYNVHDTITLDELRSYILNVSDNQDSMDVADVEIISYIDSNFLGTYEVVYQVKDQSGQTGISKLTIHIKDLEAPVVELMHEIIVDVNTLEPYVYEYLKVTDNYNELSELQFSKTGTVDMSKIGSYRVIVTVKDLAKNETIFPVIIKVLDRVSPTIEGPTLIEVTNFYKPLYESLYKVTDNYDKTLKMMIKDEHVNYQEIGSYQVQIIVSDASLNQTSIFVDIHVKDDISPELILKNVQVFISVFSEPVDLLEYVESVSDNYDLDLDIVDIVITGTVDYQNIGLYKVTYQIMDQSKNIGTNQLYIHIKDYEAPIIHVSMKEIKVGEKIYLPDFFLVTDNYDGDITHLLKFTPGYIPTHQEGHYEVIAYVYDSSGNYHEEKVMITVLPNDDIYLYLTYMGGFIVIVGSISLFYIYKKKREKRIQF